MNTTKTYKPRIMKNLLYTITLIMTTCFGVAAQSPTENYIKTTTYTAPSTGTITENDTIVNVTYFDGLGRPKQSVAVRGGASRLDHNLIPWRENWTVGSGSAPFFSQAGQTSENERELGLDPFGNTSMLWKCGNDANSNADGGWDTHFFAIDNTVGYRYTVWVKRTGSLDGNTYHGVRNVNTLADVPHANPYFWGGDLPQLEQWYLLVGVVHPHNFAGGDTGVSGVYDTQGNKVLDGTEFKWDGQNSTSRFRNFLYYSTDTNVRQYFYNPVLQKLDGTEASIDDIVFERGAPDIITPIVYDNFGRQTKDYLPYAAATQNGNIHIDPLTELENFYNASKYQNTTNPYSEKILEASPLNRVMEQGAPGADWVADPLSDTDHTIKFEYRANTAGDQVQLFGVSLTPDYIPTLDDLGFYNAGTLYKTITKDENWQPGDGNLHTTSAFKDQWGRVVLKRTYADMPTELATQHNTYYIYDDFGNLSFVIPPKVDTSDGVSQEELDELCYRYRYDYRNRLVEKKIPGKGWEYIVYNTLDQPVLTQDPNLADNDQWLFTKYDKFGRVVYTGIFSSSDSRIALQTTMNGITDLYDTKADLPTIIDGTNVYYDNTAFPTTGTEVLTINYYDNYTFDLDGAVEETAYGITPTTETRGLATGSKIRVLGTDQWITSVTWYDEKARPIYSYTENPYLNTTDKLKSKLDFVGKVLETTSVHTKDGQADITSIEKFSYDRMGRLLKQTHQIAGQPEETLAENVYDALGQLIQKNVGNTAAAPLQTVDYSYNIRGWLTEINDTENIGNDLFTFNIRYNNPVSGTALYNGNISQSLWRTANVDGALKDYTYSYDALNRITGATHNTGNYDLTAISYDKNGNILSLNRQGHINEAADLFGAMDNLVYTYDTGNKLLRVEDTADDAFGFKDDAVGVADNTNDYSYDSNGNLLFDTNKGITTISYNHLNMPTEIIFNSDPNQKIIYLYTADGIKQQKVVNDGGVFTTTDYAGGYIYENSSLKFVTHPEGYIEPDGGGNYNYVYQFTDHIGNKRLSYSDSNKDGAVDSSEIIKENHFYPFGLKHRGYNSVVNGTYYNWDFQGQEFTEDLELNTHEWKYRISDPAIGRFWQIDPLAEDYVYNGTYNFAENRVIDGFELEGLEWVDSKFDRLADHFHSVNSSSPPLSEQSKQNFKNVVKGTGNIAAGVIGTVGSIIYIGGTSGTGAALGGSTALTFSITEIGIGMGQIADALTNDSSNTTLQNSSSLPGLIAHETGSEHAELIDAAGQFIPGMLTGGNIKTIIDSPTTIINSPDAKSAVTNALSTVDAVLDTKGVVDAVVGSTTTNNSSQTRGNSNTTQGKPKILPISSDLEGVPDF